MPTQLRVVGVMAATNGIMLFVENGAPQVLPDNAWRTKEILEEVLPKITANPGVAVEIDISNYSVVDKIGNLGKNVKVDEKSGVVSIQTGKHKIEGEAVTRMMQKAYDTKSAKGLKNFLRLMKDAKVEHSVEELIEFIDKGDLYIADDGSVIAYKILCAKDGHFVDPHTKTVQQDVGSIVFMPRSKVDPNRRTACSTGLHICSHKYVKDFYYHGGNNLFLVKIKPQDVIAVPRHDHKCRASAYHIVAQLPNAIGEQISKGTKIEDIELGRVVLDEVIAGNHAPIRNRVEVGERGAFKASPVTKVRERKTKKVVARAGTSIRREESQVNVKAVKDIVKKAKDDAYPKKLAQAQALYDAGTSIRDISKMLKMDRESLGKNLDRSKAA